MTATIPGAVSQRDSRRIRGLVDFNLSALLIGWHGRGRRRRLRGPFDDLKLSIEMLDSCGAAFHPVAAVYVNQAVDGADHRMVDVTADHAVDMLAAALGAQRLLELADEVDGVLDLELDPA